MWLGDLGSKEESSFFTASTEGLSTKVLDRYDSSDDSYLIYHGRIGKDKKFMNARYKVESITNLTASFGGMFVVLFFCFYPMATMLSEL